MKYLLFNTKPLGNPKISNRNFVAPVKCKEGWFVNIKFKDICIAYGWVGFTEVEDITPIILKDI